MKQYKDIKAIQKMISFKNEEPQEWPFYIKDGTHTASFTRFRMASAASPGGFPKYTAKRDVHDGAHAFSGKAEIIFDRVEGDPLEYIQRFVMKISFLEHKDLIPDMQYEIEVPRKYCKQTSSGILYPIASSYDHKAIAKSILKHYHCESRRKAERDYGECNICYI